MNFRDYKTNSFYDELFEANGESRPCGKILVDGINALSHGELKKRQKALELALLNMGITFAVYGNETGNERIFPVDMLPRIIDKMEWDELERGLKQRIKALNLFIHDIYHEKKILKDKKIPRELIASGKCYRKECEGLNPPEGIWCHITGTDLIRHNDGKFYVLEDNLRCPSGVSYVLENRLVIKRTFPQIFQNSSVLPVDDYPFKLLQMLRFVARGDMENPNVVVLTPGIYNSAYYEHTFLAQQMGVPLVQGTDLVVNDDIVYMRTTEGFERVDVIYRRIDDTFLDPKVFNRESMIGVPGLFQAYAKGNVTLVNAPGTGIADDKAVYSYVPDMIRYYLSEEPILSNVETYRCSEDKARDYVLNNLDKLVVKAANEAGGYGMLMGPKSSMRERAAFKSKIKANPRNYIAQPVLNLSQVPTICKGKIEGRHVDLRPYILYGKDIYVMPGGLTRVALKKGSLVVNSSQGGGSKDTWVIRQKGF